MGNRTRNSGVIDENIDRTVTFSDRFGKLTLRSAVIDRSLNDQMMVTRQGVRYGLCLLLVLSVRQYDLCPGLCQPAADSAADAAARPGNHSNLSLQGE